MIIGIILVCISLIAIFAIFLYKKIYNDNNVGVYLSPILVQVLRILLSFLMGQFLGMLASVLDIYTGVDLISHDWYFLLGILLGVGFWIEDDIPNKVPVNHVGVLTFLDKRYGIFFREGSYTWYGKKFFFNISKEALYGSKNVGAIGEEQGYVYVGSRNLRIFDKAAKRKDNVTNNPELSNVTKNKSIVTTNLTIVIKTLDPIQWMLSDDAVLRICEKARAAFRIAISHFIDIDCTSIKAPLQALLMGKTVITAFIVTGDQKNFEGGIVRSKSDVPLYSICDYIPESDTERRTAEREAFITKLRSETSELMLNLVTSNNEINVSFIGFGDDDGLISVVADTGAVLGNVIVSDVHLSKAVAAAYEEYASERGQYLAQTTSANTQDEVRKKLTLKPGDDRTAQLLAAAIDGTKGISITHVTDSSKGEEASEFVKGASLIADSNKK